MGTRFITRFLEGLNSFLKRNQSSSPIELTDNRPELVLRSPGPVVYLYKAGAYYKLGRTKNVRKRNKQIKLQLPFRAFLVHVIYTDDEVWLEKHWHTEFAAKRQNGEWFELDATEVERFCAREEMPRPDDVLQSQFVFQEGHALPSIEYAPDSASAVAQANDRVMIIREVENHYQQLAILYPKRIRALQVSWKHQLNSIDSEVNRLKQQRTYSEPEALQEWKRKAIMSANAKIRP